MKTIKIKSLSLTNFKGIKNRSFDFNCNSVNFYGENATGKTTIVDAFLWLLFNKNSAGSSDFSIKPIDKDGNVLHNVDYSVAATFEITTEDCKYETELKKVLREKYTKKRGETTATFTGHETTYFKDGVPKLLKEYQQEVDKLCSEDLFRMLTAPFYFNRMDKKTKREVLLKAIPNISDLDVVEKNVNLYPLLNELKNLTIEELLAKYKATATNANKQIPAYGYKIEELNSMITTTSEEEDLENIENVKLVIDNQKEYIANLQEQRNSKTNLSLMSKINSEINDLKNDYETLKNNVLLSKKLKVKDLQNELFVLQNDEFKAKSECFNHKNEQEKIDKQILMKETKIDELKQLIEIAYIKCEEIDSELFRGDTICPTCGRDLPQEQIEQAISLFNLDKANRLEKTIENGKKLKEQLNTCLLEKDALIDLKLPLNEQLNKNENELEFIQENIIQKNEEIAKIQNEEISETEEMAEIKKAILTKEKDKEELLNISSSASDLAFTISQEQQKLDEMYSRKARYENNLANRKRITELEEEQKKLSETYNVAIDQMKLCEDFLREKVKMLEKEVNNLFSKVKFTMFKEQINGGYEEVCYATIDGVPFDDANNASKINAGLDIIKTLQQVENVIAPIFIDNAESVTSFDELINTQIIKLYVKENEKELTMEVK